MTESSAMGVVVDETSAERVGQRLKALRLGLGLSQQEMCRQMGYTSPKGQAWNNFETGHTRLTMDGFMRLCRKFPIPFTWVYSGVTDDLTQTQRELIARGRTEIRKQGRTGKRTTYSKVEEA